jgi:hypothetical protein
MTFRQRESERVFSIREELFSEAAWVSLLEDGVHIGLEFREENLFRAFRNEALQFFANRKIQWHPKDRRIETSIVSSQVSCVNCLFAFVSNPVELSTWLREIYPELHEVLPIDSKTEPPLKNGTQPFLSFEWIGERNYLGE